MNASKLGSVAQENLRITITGSLLLNGSTVESIRIAGILHELQDILSSSEDEIVVQSKITNTTQGYIIINLSSKISYTLVTRHGNYHPSDTSKAKMITAKPIPYAGTNIDPIDRSWLIYGGNTKSQTGWSLAAVENRVAVGSVNETVWKHVFSVGDPAYIYNNKPITDETIEAIGILKNDPQYTPTLNSNHARYKEELAIQKDRLTSLIELAKLALINNVQNAVQAILPYTTELETLMQQRAPDNQYEFWSDLLANFNRLNVPTNQLSQLADQFPYNNMFTYANGLFQFLHTEWVTSDEAGKAEKLPAVTAAERLVALLEVVKKINQNKIDILGWGGAPAINTDTLLGLNSGEQAAIIAAIDNDTRPNVQYSVDTIKKLMTRINENTSGDSIDVPYAGYVRIWEHDKTTNMWRKIGDIAGSLNPPGTEGGGDGIGIGFCLALSGDGTRLAIGNPWWDGPTSNTRLNLGRVLLYKYNSTAEQMDQRWIPVYGDNPELNLDFTPLYDFMVGNAVALSHSGKTIAISCQAYGTTATTPYYNQQGRVDILEDNGTEYINVKSFIGRESVFERYGASISLDSLGHRIVLGSPWKDRNPMLGVGYYDHGQGKWVGSQNNEGCVEVFERRSGVTYPLGYLKDGNKDPHLWEPYGAALYGQVSKFPMVTYGNFTGQHMGEWLGSMVKISPNGKRIVTTSPYFNENIDGVDYSAVGIVQIWEDPKVKDQNTIINSSVSWNRIGKIYANLNTVQMNWAWTPQWVDSQVGGNHYQGWFTNNMADGFSIAMNENGSQVAIGLSVDQNGYGPPGIDAYKAGSARVYEDTMTDRFVTGFTEAKYDGQGLIDVASTSTNVIWDEIMTIAGGGNEWLGYIVALSNTAGTPRLFASAPYWEPRLPNELISAVEGDPREYSIIQKSDVLGQSNYGCVRIYDLLQYTHASIEDKADEAAEAAAKAAEEAAKAAETAAAAKAAEEQAAATRVAEEAAAAALIAGIQTHHATLLKQVTFVHGPIPGKATADPNTIAKLKNIVGEAGITRDDKRKRRHAALKLMFAQTSAATVNKMVIPKTHLGLHTAFKATNAVVVKAGEVFDVSTLGTDEGFYSVLDNGETISFKTTKATTIFTRADSGNDERYTVSLGINEKWSDIVVNVDRVSAGNLKPDGTGYLKPDDIVSIDNRVYIMGSIGDGGSGSGSEAGASSSQMGLQFNGRSIDNKYIIGSGVGAVTGANRAAYRRRANNNAQQLPCCNWRHTWRFS